MRKKVIAILLSLTIVLGNSSMVFASANTEMENSVQAVVEEQEETQTGETQTYQATSTQKNVVESENEVNPVSTNADDDVLSYTITDPTKKTVAVKGNGKSLNMTSITIPSTTEIDGVTYTVTALDISAFCSHSALETVTIPETIETIGENAFQECSSLLSVSIPNSVTSIGNSVFEECSSLSSVSIPEGVTSIEHDTFHMCTGLIEVQLPSTIEYIRDHAFQDCTSLKSISIPQGVESIERGAFIDCNSLERVQIPSSVNDIGVLAFPMDMLKTAGPQNSESKYNIEYGWEETIPTCASNLFASCSTITLPNTLKTIETKAFWNCTLIENITIPDSVTSIGKNAFEQCQALDSITIPQNIKCIEESTFASCTKLKSITFYDTVTDIGENAFFNCSKLEKVLFCGTGNLEEKWGKITIGSSNECLTKAEKEYLSSNTGWYNVSGVWYYNEKPYCPVKNAWVDKDGKLRYLGQDGAMKTNAFVDRNTYYVDEDGIRKTGFFDLMFNKVTGKEEACTYYADDTGTLEAFQWIHPDDYWYYLSYYAIVQKNTVMKCGKNSLGLDPDIKYYLDQNGRRVIDCWVYDVYDVFAEATGSFYANESGILFQAVKEDGWQELDGKWFYMDNGRVKVDTFIDQYYVNNKGKRVISDFIHIGDKCYYADAAGITVEVKKGWQELDGKKYYINDKLVPLTGWQSIDGKQYYMDASGVMATGWQEIEGKTYYFSNSGAMVTGRQEIEGKIYYFSNSGDLISSSDDVNSKSNTLSTDNQSPVTGDYSPVMRLAILLLVSGIGFVALVIERKRREQMDKRWTEK